MSRCARLLVALLLVACGDAPEAPIAASNQTPGAGGPIEENAGPRTAAVMREATRVTIYRVADPERDADFAELARTKPKVGGHPIREQRAATAEEGRILAVILTDSQTYVPPERRSACLFKTDYVVRFERDTSTVDAEICFSCGDVIIRPSAGLRESLVMTGWGFEPGENVVRLKKILGAGAN